MQLRSFYIRTYGCQMNELDSEILSGMLQERGMVPSPDEQADLVIFNTCSVRDLSERKVLGKIGLMGKPKKRPIIGVMGCMANAKKQALFRELPHVDFILGTNNIHDVHLILDKIEKGESKLSLVENQFHEELDYTKAYRRDRYKAFVSIIRGCNKFCTYCVVPYTRGQEVSRDPTSILEECRRLVGEGYQEVVLLGQNVNSYGKDRPEYGLFHDLLYKIHETGIARIRFLTSHPTDISTDLINAIRDLPSVCHHLHFPLQSGSNRILHKMHRMYTKEEYFEKVDQIKEKIPDIALGTDMIIGFPTETEDEFQETLDALRTIQYTTAFLYMYSPRANTPASRWADDISPETKHSRHQEALRLYQQIAQELMQKKIGDTVEVLVERENKNSSLLKGVTRCWRDVIFPGSPTLIGSLQRVKLHSLVHQTWIGELCNALPS